MRIEPKPITTMSANDSGKSRVAASATEATPRISAPMDRRTGSRPTTEHEAERGQQRSDTRCGHEEPVARGIAPEIVLGEGGDEHAEVHADRRHGPDHDRRQQHDPRPTDVAEAFGKVLDHGVDGRGSGDPGADLELGLVHQPQADDHGEEAERVDREGCGHAEGTDGQARRGRAHDTSPVEHRRVERDGRRRRPRGRRARPRTTGEPACPPRSRFQAGTRARRSSRPGRRSR